MADTGVVPWRKARLGDLCRMYQPETITKKQMNDSGAYPVYGANGIMGRHDRFNHDASQLIIGCRGACGTVHVTEPKSWITGNSMVIQPINGEVDLHYLRYFFSGPADLPSAITGAAQPQITQASLKPIAVPLPPLEEQKRIVAVLNQAFAALDRARALAEANLADAGELFARTKADLMADLSSKSPSEKMKNLVAFLNGDRGKNYPNKAEYVPSGISWINTGHINSDGTLSSERMNYITQAKYDKLGGGKTQAGDVVFCLRGATIGKTALVGEHVPGAVASSLMIIRPSEKVIAAYIYYYLTSDLGKGEIARFIGGAAQPNLAGNSVGEFDIPLPSIEAQAELVDRLDHARLNCSKLTMNFANKAVAIADLRQCLLQKAFARELT